jgi:hypothetical protein
MESVTYYVVVTFDRNNEGELQSGEPREAPSSEAARRRAATLSRNHVGVVAFSRTGDPARGEFDEAVILSQASEVDADALTA